MKDYIELIDINGVKLTVRYSEILSIEENASQCIITYNEAGTKKVFKPVNCRYRDLVDFLSRNSQEIPRT